MGHLLSVMWYGSTYVFLYACLYKHAKRDMSIYRTAYRVKERVKSPMTEWTFITDPVFDLLYNSPAAGVATPQ